LVEEQRSIDKPYISRHEVAHLQMDDIARDQIRRGEQLPMTIAPNPSQDHESPAKHRQRPLSALLLHQA
jgi:hypothetical protein